MNIIKGFIIAFSMFSKIPMPDVKWEEENMKYVFCFFPFIGLLIGAVEILWYSIAEYMGLNNIVFGAVATLIPVALTGGIHIDGFMDTSDALGSHRDKEKMIEILGDSHVGAFAIINTVIYFLLFFGAMASVKYIWQVQMCMMSFFVSRAVAVFFIISTDTFKNNGLLYTFKNSANKVIVALFSVVFIIISAGIIEALNVLLGMIVVAALIVTAFYFNSFIVKKFGGINGDLIGWFISVCEIVSVIVIGVGGTIL